MTARALGALTTLYVVWGSTYLGIMLAIRTMPPFLMSAARFLVAGGLLFAISPRRRMSLRAWAAGSLYSRHTSSLPAQPMLASGMEMLMGGALLAVAGLAAGEGGQVHLSHVSAESWLALPDLGVIGP